MTHRISIVRSVSWVALIVIGELSLPATALEATTFTPLQEPSSLSLHSVQDPQFVQRPNGHSGEASKILMHQLWKNRIQAPTPSPGHIQEDLAQLIHRIQSVDVSKAGIPMEKAHPVLPVAESDPNLPGTLPPLEVPLDANATTSVSPFALSGSLSEQTISRLEQLDMNNVTVEQALMLAELLYETGYTNQALPFYRQVARQLNPNRPLYEDDKAWVLFQWGNCVRHSDPAAAKRLYLQVQTQFPEAPWVALASFRHDLADWHWKETPRELLNQVQPATFKVAAPSGTQVAKGDSTQ